MKSQIALLGIGLVIASGVAYAELKPASDTPTISTVATPIPTASDSAIPTLPMASPAASKSSSKIKNPPTKKSLVPTISKPTISGGGDDDDDEDERGEGREEDDD
jgi:hypothetical protein